MMDDIKKVLHTIYDDVLDKKETELWEFLLQKYSTKWADVKAHAKNKSLFNESLVFVITYADSLNRDGENSLKTLGTFLSKFTQDCVTGVHILPYFPYSSDDGFSISDYRQIREDLGTWDDVHRLAEQHVLMSDLVLNHCSSKHQWFKDFLKCKKPYDDFFITGDKNADYSRVVRPRPHFILNTFETTEGEKHVWTTFSRDQVDLNFANPRVLFEMLDTMMDYVQEHKISVIRLDAIAYLWKELGTRCLHHTKTHMVVKLIRAIFDFFAPQSIIVTETNVPHEENIQYFGSKDKKHPDLDTYPEAHMIYQFPLPPLLLHAFVKEDSSYFTQWAKKLDQPKENKTYFNFCASHDGIGMTPTHGILPEEERNFLIKTAESRGAKISYKATADGEIPYEINVNFLSAITSHDKSNTVRAAAFLASQSIVLAMPGVPGIYIHSLLGSQNWSEGVELCGSHRSINREKLNVEIVNKEISDEQSIRAKVFNGYLTLLRARKKSVAFHPFASCEIIPSLSKIIAFVRGDAKYGRILCITNISDKEVVQDLENTKDQSVFSWKQGCVDLITENKLFFSNTKHKTKDDVIEITLKPYQVMWLQAL